MVWFVEEGIGSWCSGEGGSVVGVIVVGVVVEAIVVVVMVAWLALRLRWLL